jgi:hypothetical protein
MVYEDSDVEDESTLLDITSFGYVYDDNLVCFFTYSCTHHHHRHRH